MADVIRFSHSRLSSFETCPLKYRFRYVDKIVVERDTIEAFLGKQVHSALEWLYRELQDRRLPDADALVARFAAGWAGGWTDDIVIVRAGDTPAAYLAMGEKCLRGYFRRYHPFDRAEVVGIEMRLEAPLDDAGQYWMNGIADRVSRLGPGVYEIRDYKTGKWVPPQDELDTDRQLALYQIAVQRCYPDAREVHLVWNYLRHDRELHSRRTPDALTRLREQTVRLILTVLEHEKQNDFPAIKSRLCDWCEYKAICPAWGAPPEAARAAATKPGHLFPI